jgi:hypothetical protein
MEKNNVTYEEAEVLKEAILICKGDERQWLIDNGVVPESNAKKRRKQVESKLRSRL